MAKNILIVIELYSTLYNIYSAYKKYSDPFILFTFLYIAALC